MLYLECVEITLIQCKCYSSVSILQGLQGGVVETCHLAAVEVPGFRFQLDHRSKDARQLLKAIEGVDVATVCRRKGRTFGEFS